MIRNLKLLALLPLILLFVTGCRVNRPDGVMSPKRMEAYLYDYHLAQAIIKNLDADKRYQSELYINWVNQKNNVTQKEVDASLIWYTRYPKEMSKVYDRLADRINRDTRITSSMMETVEKKSFSIVSGDSVDLWYLKRTSMLLPSVYMNKVLFNIATDTSFYRADTLTWYLNNTFFRPAADSSLTSAYISLSAYYKDSIATVDTLICQSGNVVLTLPFDRSMVPDNIRGAVTYIDSTANPLMSMLMSDVYLIRQHRKHIE